MREERFRIQCPKHFLVGDSEHFEKSSQEKDSDFVVDYAPPEIFEAGIVLQEMMILSVSTRHWNILILQKPWETRQQSLTCLPIQRITSILWRWTFGRWI